MPSSSMDPSLAPLLQCLPDLDALSEKVARVHGPSQPHLLAVRESYLGLAVALDSLARGRDEASSALDAARCLRSLRGLSQGYQPPANACRSYRSLYAGLAALDQASTPRLATLAQLEPATLPSDPPREDWRPGGGACGHTH